MTPLPPPLVRRFRDGAGTESDSLLAFRGGRPLDPRGISDLLAFGYLAGRRTLLTGVEALIPEWPLAPPSTHPDSLDVDGRADRLWALLSEAVQRAVDGGGRVRTTLSGGLDSRAVAAALAAIRPDGCSAGTFGDPDCDDLPTARRVAEALELPHEVSEFAPEAALLHEERVWHATDGIGGPAAAPGASTDEGWAEACDVLLSGTSGDVIWGASVRPGPSPARRLKRLGVPFHPPTWDDEIPAPPAWVSPAGGDAWQNLWTRQAGGTWGGARSRLPHTPVVPILWDEPLLAFCLTLDAEDRWDRGLVRRMLQRHAPAASTDAIPLSPRGPVHDLDRAMASSAWTRELNTWLEQADFAGVGIKRRGAARLVAKIRQGRNRSGSLSRVRALTRWAV
ncbi:MAG: asparagine synthase [Proteobacteria bacterium]|nr:asparagine synthase [Pseudomonadota bacterium]